MVLDEIPQLDAKSKLAWKMVQETLGFTERVLGLVDWHWEFLEIDLHGRGTRRRQFELFDEILCHLLLVEEGLTGDQIRSLLGLEGTLGRKAFQAMLSPLLSTMIAGDESYYLLTEKGRVYARQGSKYLEFEESFRLLIDVQDLGYMQAPALKRSLGSPVQTDWVEYETDAVMASLGWPGNLEALREYALVQAPEVHLPEKGFFLDEALVKSVKRLQYPIRIALIEDFQAQEVRLKAISGNKPQFIPAITQALNHASQQEVIDVILDQFIQSQSEDKSVGEKSEVQKEDEAWLMAQQSKLDAQESPARKKDLQQELELQRKNFDTLSFEEELEWLVEHCQEEFWVVSPWIRERAWKAREKQIRRLLRRNCRVFLAYSSPHRSSRSMVAEETLAQIHQLAGEFPGFYWAELPQFHEKVVFALVDPQTKYEYTGSFNVLSLYARNLSQVGRENMRRLQWGDDSEKNHQYIGVAFFIAERERFQQYCVDGIALRLGGAKNLDELESEFRNRWAKVQWLGQRFSPEEEASLNKLKAGVEEKLLQVRKERTLKSLANHKKKSK